MTTNGSFIITYEDSVEPGLCISLNRFLTFVLKFHQLNPGEIKILLVGINDRTDSVWDADMFIKNISAAEKYKDIKGILFLTSEQLPKGDRIDSNLNQSRMIRELFENSFHALTANHSDIISRLYQLVGKIFTDKSSPVEENQASKIANNMLTDLMPKIKSELLKEKEFIEGLEGEIKNYREEETLNFLSYFYLIGGIHSTRIGHDSLRGLYDTIEKKECAPQHKEIEALWKKIRLLEKVYDLASIVASYSLRFPGLKILVIDDKPGKIKECIEEKEIIQYFPLDTEIFITKQGEWKRFLEDNRFWADLYNGKAQLECEEIKNHKSQKTNNIGKNTEEAKFLIGQRGFKFDYVVVDLLMEDYNEGNMIINNLVHFRGNYNRLNPDKKSYWDIIAFSLSEEAHDISRALSEGSLYYVHKSRPFMLPAVIAKLEKSRQILRDREEYTRMEQKSRNFGKLYRLAEFLKRQLRSKPFLDRVEPMTFSKRYSLKDSDQFVRNVNRYIEVPALEWIKQMPKADLHFHLGGSIPPDTAFYLSLNMLTPYSHDSIEIKAYEKQLESRVRKICDLLMVILNKKPEKFLNFFRIFDIAMKSILNGNRVLFSKSILKMEGGKGKEKKSNHFDSWRKRIKSYSDGYIKNSGLTYEKYKKNGVQQTFFKILEYINKELNLNQNIEQESPNGRHSRILSYDFPGFQVFNIFNVIIGFIEGKNKTGIKDFWTQLKETNTFENCTSKQGKINSNELNREFVTRRDLLGLSHKEIEKNYERNIDFYKKIRDFLPAGFVPHKKINNILGQFISAKKRVTTSLVQYLGGNEFIGSDQLQRKENIFAVLFSIIKRKVQDNVRYLEIRLSPDGYTKENLTMHEAIKTLLECADLITWHFYTRGDFIRVNYIFCVKRHKPPDQAALETSAAIVNRERENIFKNIIPRATGENIFALKYEWKPSRVVGVDLAGIEKENPASRFVNDFYPLFKTSFFITIHAGEEDTAQSIWEAVYLLHANRIGHGLTLRGNPYLTDLFRDLQICVEMNPISNLLTNPNIYDEYPFFEFVNKGLNVTINTDNQSVSDCTLSEEFVKAAELFQQHRMNAQNYWISKWDILRVIRNSFISSFLSRDEKRDLMRAVEEEIYRKIIKEYGF